MPKKDPGASAPRDVSHLRITDENYLANILVLANRLTQSQIAEKLKIDDSRVSRIIRKAVSGGLLVETCPGSKPKFYELTRRGKLTIRKIRQSSKKSPCFLTSSYGATSGRRIANFHDFRVKVPIIVDKEIAAWDSINDKFRNWSPKYMRVPGEGVTFEKTPDNIVIILNCPGVESTAEGLVSFSMWLHKTLFSSQKFLWVQGIGVDMARAEVVYQHIANEMPEFESAIPKYATASVKLGRPALSSIGPVDREARAWFDRSNGPLEIETDDLLYESKFILMPEFVADIHSVVPELRESIVSFRGDLSLYSENIQSHLAAIQELRDCVRELRDFFNGGGVLSWIMRIFRMIGRKG